MGEVPQNLGSTNKLLLRFNAICIASWLSMHRASESALKVTAPDWKKGETTMQGPKKVKQREQLRLS